MQHHDRAFPMEDLLFMVISLDPLGHHCKTIGSTFYFAFIISFDCSYFTHDQFKQISIDVVFISSDVTQFLKLGEGENGLLSAK